MAMTTRPPFPIPLFAQLVHRLRHTNARYDFIAYQCRHTQRRTHHAQRRARCVGLYVDTEKARATSQRCARPEACVAVTSEVRSVWESPSPVWDEDDDDEAEVVEDADEAEGEDAVTPDMRTERVLVRTSPAISPLDLTLRTVDDDQNDHLEVETYSMDLDNALLPPGAPRWRTLPLPDADAGAAPQNVETAMKLTRTYDTIRRGLGRGVVRPPRASSASLSGMPVNALPCYPADHGIALSMRPLKRKLDDDANSTHGTYAFGDECRGTRCNLLPVLG